jgi:hypothetical protein
LVFHTEGGHTLKESENRMLRKVFGPKGEEVTGK